MTTDGTDGENPEMIASIECMEARFRERLQKYISELKSCITSADREKAEQLFLEALPVFSLKFPDPDEVIKEENTDSVQA